MSFFFCFFSFFHERKDLVWKLGLFELFLGFGW